MCKRRFSIIQLIGENQQYFYKERTLMYGKFKIKEDRQVLISDFEYENV